MVFAAFMMNTLAHHIYKLLTSGATFDDLDVIDQLLLQIGRPGFDNTSELKNDHTFSSGTFTFNPETSYVSTGHTPILGTTSFQLPVDVTGSGNIAFPATVSMWVHPTDVKNMTLMTLTGNFPMIRLASTGEVQVYNNSTSTILSSTEQIEFNDWTHLCFVFQADASIDLYINGSKKASSTASLSQSFISPSFSIGIDPAVDGTLTYTGYVDSFRVYGKALSPQEVYDLLAFEGTYNMVKQISATFSPEVSILSKNSEFKKGTSEISLFGEDTSGPSLTLPDNLALRATFETGVPVYIKSGVTMSVATDTFVVSNTITPVQGLTSGYKQLNTSTFDVSNFIGSPWTISFWYYHNYPNTNTAWKTVMSTSNWVNVGGSWRMYFQSGTNKLGIYQNSGAQFQTTTVNLADIYQKWTLIAFTSNSNQTTTIKVKTLDQSVNYENTFSALDLDAVTSGITMEFGDGNAEFPTLDTYYDDIRIYNVELNSTQLESLWTEHVTSYSFTSISTLSQLHTTTLQYKLGNAALDFTNDINAKDRALRIGSGTGGFFDLASTTISYWTWIGSGRSNTPGQRISNNDAVNTQKTPTAGSGGFPGMTMSRYYTLNNGDVVYTTGDHYGDVRSISSLFDNLTGNWSYSWHPKSDELNEYIGYKFSTGNVIISQMNFYQQPGNHYAGDLDISYWNGSSWVNVQNQSQTGFINTTYNEKIEITFNTISAQYVRVYVQEHASNNTDYVGLSEWEIISGQTGNEILHSFDRNSETEFPLFYLTRANTSDDYQIHVSNLTSSTPYPDIKTEQWTHFAWTFTMDNGLPLVNCYLNGTHVFTTSSGISNHSDFISGSSSQVSTIEFGDPYGTDNYEKYMDAIQIYRRKLTEHEIRYLYLQQDKSIDSFNLDNSVQPQITINDTFFSGSGVRLINGDYVYTTNQVSSGSGIQELFSSGIWKAGEEAYVLYELESKQTIGGLEFVLTEQSQPSAITIYHYDEFQQLIFTVTPTVVYDPSSTYNIFRYSNSVSNVKYLKFYFQTETEIELALLKIYKGGVGRIGSIYVTPLEQSANFRSFTNYQGTTSDIYASGTLPDFDFHSPFTIAFWFMVQYGYDNVFSQEIFRIGNDSNFRFAYKDKKFYHGLHTTITDNNATADTVTQNKRWYHLALQYDPSAQNTKLYVNSILDETSVASSGTFGSLQTDEFVLFPNNQVSVNIAIDEFAVYQRILEPFEIEQVYANGTIANLQQTGAPEGLIGYYTFDANAVTNLPNTIPNEVTTGSGSGMLTIYNGSGVGLMGLKNLYQSIRANEYGLVDQAPALLHISGDVQDISGFATLSSTIQTSNDAKVGATAIQNGVLVDVRRDIPYPVSVSGWAKGSGETVNDLELMFCNKTSAAWALKTTSTSPEEFSFGYLNQGTFTAFSSGIGSGYHHYGVSMQSDGSFDIYLDGSGVYHGSLGTLHQPYYISSGSGLAFGSGIAGFHDTSAKPMYLMDSIRLHNKYLLAKDYENIYTYETNQMNTYARIIKQNMTHVSSSFTVHEIGDDYVKYTTNGGYIEKTLDATVTKVNLKINGSGTVSIVSGSGANIVSQTITLTTDPQIIEFQISAVAGQSLRITDTSSIELYDIYTNASDYPGYKYIGVSFDYEGTNTWIQDIRLVFNDNKIFTFDYVDQTYLVHSALEVTGTTGELTYPSYDDSNQIYQFYDSTTTKVNNRYDKIYGVYGLIPPLSDLRCNATALFNGQFDWNANYTNMLEISPNSAQGPIVNKEYVTFYFATKEPIHEISKCLHVTSYSTTVGNYAWKNVKVYGTNMDPSEMAKPSDPSNWNLLKEGTQIDVNGLSTTATGKNDTHYANIQYSAAGGSVTIPDPYVSAFVLPKQTISNFTIVEDGFDLATQEIVITGSGITVSSGSGFTTITTTGNIEKVIPQTSSRVIVKLRSTSSNVTCTIESYDGQVLITREIGPTSTAQGPQTLDLRVSLQSEAIVKIQGSCELYEIRADQGATTNTYALFQNFGQSDFINEDNLLIQTNYYNDGIDRMKHYSTAASTFISFMQSLGFTFINSPDYVGYWHDRTDFIEDYSSQQYQDFFKNGGESRPLEFYLDLPANIEAIAFRAGRVDDGTATYSTNMSWRIEKISDSSVVHERTLVDNVAELFYQEFELPNNTGDYRFVVKNTTYGGMGLGYIAFRLPLSELYDAKNDLLLAAASGSGTGFSDQELTIFGSGITVSSGTGSYGEYWNVQINGSGYIEKALPSDSVSVTIEAQVMEANGTATFEVLDTTQTNTLVSRTAGQTAWPQNVILTYSSGIGQSLRVSASSGVHLYGIDYGLPVVEVPKQYLGFYGTYSRTDYGGIIYELIIDTSARRISHTSGGGDTSLFDDDYINKIKWLPSITLNTYQGQDDLSKIFDGSTTNKVTSGDSNIHITGVDNNKIAFYIIIPKGISITGGKYWTLAPNPDNQYIVTSLKIYTTEEDPQTMTDPQDLSNWTLAHNMTNATGTAYPGA